MARGIELNGPAVMRADGTVEWWIEGVRMEEEDVLGAEDRMKAWWESGVADPVAVEKVEF